jgi:hypothetical protein
MDRNGQPHPMITTETTDDDDDGGGLVLVDSLIGHWWNVSCSTGGSSEIKRRVMQNTKQSCLSLYIPYHKQSFPPGVPTSQVSSTWDPHTNKIRADFLCWPVESRVISRMWRAGSCFNLRHLASQ